MNVFTKLKDSLVGMLSPSDNGAKRRRTIGPGIEIEEEHKEHIYFAPNSEPRDLKANAAYHTRVKKKHLSHSNIKNPRKRTFEEITDAECEISPDDSISQVMQNRSSSGCSSITTKYKKLTVGEIVDEEIEEVYEEEGDNEDVADDDCEGDDEDVSEEEDEVEQESGSEDIDEEEEIKELDDGDEAIDAGISDENEDDAGDERETSEDESLNEVEGEDVEMEDYGDYQDPIAAARAKVENYLRSTGQLEQQVEEIERMRTSGTYHPDHVFLHERMAMRMFEPALPLSWKIDFRTIPEGCFAKDENEATVININHGFNAGGIKALQGLHGLAIRVHDKIKCIGSGTEQLIGRQIRSYIKWTERDGGYVRHRFIPVIWLYVCKPRDQNATRKFESQMQFLASRYRDQLAITNELGVLEGYRRPRPLIYGLFVAHTRVAVFTLDSANPGAQLMLFGTYDLFEKEAAVWHGFAIAYVAIMARNYIMSIKDILEIDDTPESDPDA